MVMLFFTCVDPAGEHRRCSYGGPTLEVGLELITTLVKGGTRLLEVELIDEGRPAMTLPVDVFDGASFKKPLTKLQYEWEAVLGDNV